ncbi:MAG: HEAT repeat domain-containing protein, partial [Planctomycetes bacterium]|nr:HEAT repeat domain-containing protein [Planctomycetota bacterium]
ALGRMQSARARNALISLLQPQAPLANAKVRAAAVEALGQYRHPDITPTLVRLADSDPSYKVEAAATRAIGTGRRIEAIDSVLANANKPSHSDRIRRAAAEALGMLGDGRGVETCLALAAYGQPDRTRPTPVAALAQLADRGHRAEHLERFCRRLLSDPERRAQVAAIDALGEMGAVASIDALGELSVQRRRRDLREGAKRAIEEIIADQAAPDAVRLLRARLGDLRERWERLHRRMRLLESELDISGDPDDDDAKDARGVG